MDHKWTLIIAKGHDAPGNSLDSIYWCERCGAVRHDYAHSGGETWPGYPCYFAVGVLPRRGTQEPPCGGRTTEGN